MQFSDGFAERVDAFERQVDGGGVAGELMQDRAQVVVDGVGDFIEGAAELVEARFENVVHDFVGFSFSNVFIQPRRGKEKGAAYSGRVF